MAGKRVKEAGFAGRCAGCGENSRGARNATWSQQRLNGDGCDGKGSLFVLYPDLAGFLSLQTMTPQSVMPIRVYIRVRNRGPYQVSAAQLKVHWTLQANPLLPLAADFCENFPQDSQLPNKNWTTAGIVNLTDTAYSGPSIADCPDRAAPFCLPPGTPPSDSVQVAILTLPSLDLGSAGNEQLSLFVTVHSAEDLALIQVSC